MATKKKAEGATTAKKKTRSRTTKKTTTKSRGSAAASASESKAAADPTGKVVVERQIGGRTLTLETGRMAKLSDGAVVARYGDTMVLACVNSNKAPDHVDFFPLTVDYREKTSAAGVIPGGFFKREGRPTTKEILACRIIDRSIRPMFPDGFRRDVQVLSQVLSTDRENDPDVVAAIASFASLAVSSLPHGQSLGMVRIGCVDDELVVNPLWSDLQSENNSLNLTVAGHADAVVMVEAGAKEVSEETMLEALELAHETVREIVGMIEELVAAAGKPKMEFTPPEPDSDLESAIDKQFGKQLRAAPVTPGPKQERNAAIKAAKEEVVAAFPAPEELDEAATKAWQKKVDGIISGIVKGAERDSILKGKRADGRDSTTVRPITIEVGVLPRVHGSVLFTRGETQALGVVTLGGIEDQQIIDGLMPEPKKRFLLHYSFPPFSVGETKRVLAPGRREIGHGALAERGLEPLLPSRDEFAYTIRVTSEILESNGSSSMATACAGTLAMMDAGVPIKQPVAGIAMGLVMQGKKYAVLSDILGSEDACGDMDFKVVGTGRGITALQMDIKCDGLTRKILAEALEQARQGRLHILREMLKALRSPRQALSPNAPRLETVQVPNEKIGLIIGPGGKNIRQMQEDFECKIAIEDSGLCTVTGLDAEKVMACLDYIKSMTAEVELGAVYEGRVTAIKEFGAFVEILPGQEGLVHVSELSNDFIRAVTDVVRIGDEVKVKVIAIDDFGKVKLSRKALLPPGESAAEAGDGDEFERDREPAGRSDSRGRDRKQAGRGRDQDDDREVRPARRSRGSHDEQDEPEARDERRPRRPRRERPDWQDDDEQPRGGRRGHGRDERDDVEPVEEPDYRSRSGRGRSSRPGRDDSFGDRDEPARRPARGRGRRDRDDRYDGRDARDDDAPPPSRSRRPVEDDERSPRAPRSRDDDAPPPSRSRRPVEDDERAPRAPRSRDDDAPPPSRSRRPVDDDERSPRAPRSRGDDGRSRRDHDDERPRRSGRDRDSDRGRRSRDDEQPPRTEAAGSRSRGGDGRRSRSPRFDEDDDDRAPTRSRRGSRDRSALPMAEFDDEPTADVGFEEAELESIDSVVGDTDREADRPEAPARGRRRTGGGGGGGGRRRRRD